MLKTARNPSIQDINGYEEGTWTVELKDAVTGGNTSATTVTGYYTKIGRLVTLSFANLNNINSTGMTNGAAIYFTLPFAAAASSGSSCGPVILDTVTLPAPTTQVFSEVESNTARARLRSFASGSADVSVTWSAISSGVSDIYRASLSYIAA